MYLFVFAFQRHQCIEQWATMAHHEEETLERMFPRCRIRSPPPMDTAILIDLSDENKPIAGQPVMNTTHHPHHHLAHHPHHQLHQLHHPQQQQHQQQQQQQQQHSHPYQSKRNVHCRDAVDSDSDHGVHAQRPAAQQRHRHSAPKYRGGGDTNADQLRRSKMRRPRTLDTWLHLYDTYGGGYEPSPDSEDNDSDDCVTYAPKNAALKKSAGDKVTSSSSAVLGVRASASESQISTHWKKPQRRVKEIYDLTPMEGRNAVAGSGAGESRLEIAGGREILSRSRTRTQRKVKKTAAPSGGLGRTGSAGSGGGGGGGGGGMAELSALTGVGGVGDSQAAHSNSTTASSSNRSINRYSGEVYYEESMGRYGFRVDGNTLWGSQGLEPSFSIPSSLNEKAAPATEIQVLKRPLSWAGDDAAADDHPEGLDQYESHGSDPVDEDKEEEEEEEEEEAEEAEEEEEEEEEEDEEEEELDEEEDEEETRTELVMGNPNPATGVASVAAGSGIRRGYLTDFYPEMLVARPQSPNSGSSSGCSGTGGGGGGASSLNLDNYLSEQLHQFTQSRKEAEPDGDELVPTATVTVATTTTTTTTTVIGGLTIAQYEGSPRRYGLRPPQTNGHLAENGTHPHGNDTKKSSAKSESLSPRPGFPRRVHHAGGGGGGTGSSTFSPSTTRQTLVELTSSGARACGSTSLFVKDAATTAVLYENVTDTDGDYINETLRWNVTEERTDVETDLGETEVGTEVGKSRNFTLSPETTDYDDSELEANDRDPLSDSPSGGDHVHKDPPPPPPMSSTLRMDGCNGHKFPSMPILADGLSSGQNSADDADDVEDETDRVPLMNDAIHRRVVVAHSRSYPHPANGCLRMGSSGALPPTAAPNGAPHQLSNAVQQLWVKNISGNLDADHDTQGSFRKFIQQQKLWSCHGIPTQCANPNLSLLWLFLFIQFKFEKEFI